jgi:hypothetical protein
LYFHENNPQAYSVAFWMNLFGVFFWVPSLVWLLHGTCRLPRSLHCLGSVPIFLFGDKNSLEVRIDWVIFLCMAVQFLQSKMGVHWLALVRLSGGIWRVA